MRHSTAYRINVRKFNKMCAFGLFEDDKVELLNGVLTMMTTNPPHDYAINTLEDLLKDRLSRDQWSVRTEQAVQLGLFWKPVPDLVVVRGRHADYGARTPGAADIALIVEVSDSSYTKDSKVKLRRYERCGLPWYWIVDLNRRRIEAREIGPLGFSAPVIYEENEEVPVFIDGKEYGRFTVSDILT